jgi:hypothetical protein
LGIKHPFLKRVRIVSNILNKLYAEKKENATEIFYLFPLCICIFDPPPLHAMERGARGEV